MGDLIALLIVVVAQSACAWLLWQDREDQSQPQDRSRRILPRLAIPLGLGVSLGWVVFAYLLAFHRVNRYFPGKMVAWVRGIGVTWAFLSVLLVGAWLVSRLLPRARASHSPARRAFLRTARVAILGVPVMTTGYGMFIGRKRIGLREQDIYLPGLPPDLDGLRLTQLTDIHLSPFLSEKELAYAVDLANETRPNLMLVTGDLITSGNDPLDACLAQLARLRAEAGVYGCNGNHEVYARIQRYVEVKGELQGMHILRSRAVPLRFGSATLNLAGVDYQNSRKPYLRGAGKLVVPGAVNVMLSHNPDVFPVAADQGYQLTISGHTHGGQVRVEILQEDLNVARFFTPYVDGLYRRGDSAVFVSRGIGTIGLPARIGAPPEVASIVLRAQNGAAPVRL